ncbi:MAG: hypothetical protein ACUVWP_08110 [bacterium]
MKITNIIRREIIIYIISIIGFFTFLTMNCKKEGSFITGSCWKEGCWARYRITYPDNIIEDVSISVVGREAKNYIIEISTLGSRRFTIGVKSPSGGIIERSEPLIGQGQVILKKGGLQAMYVPIDVLNDMFDGNLPYMAFEIPGYNMSNFGRETLFLPDGTKIETEHYRYLSQGKTIDEVWVSPKVPILGIVKRVLEDKTSVMLVDYGEKGAMKIIVGEVLPYNPTFFEEKTSTEKLPESKIETKETRVEPKLKGLLDGIIKKKQEGEK